MINSAAHEQQVLDLLVVCLKTANFDLTLADVVKDRITVIDFWTTRCTRCPAALDKLNELAQQLPDIQFVSICCDCLDGAREILEQTDVPRWHNVSHYFMAQSDKETAKRLLGFRLVPFYVVYDADGQMVFSGGKLDSDRLPGSQPATSTPEPVKATARDSPTDVLVIDDLDF